MGVYFGQAGEIALKRDSLQAALKTQLDPFDVNTSTKRFSVDHSSGSLITGDEVEIETVDKSTLELVSGHNYPDVKKFINVDPVGGIRLYNSFAAAIEGLQANALTLVTPSAAKDILIRTRNERYRHVAGVKDFEMTTTREQVDLTNLGDEFRNQFEAGLISGHSYPDGKWFVNVDPLGGLRLYNSFAAAIEGLQTNALTLVTPSSAKDILIRTRNERYRHVAGVKDFEMTTSREQVDLTNLGDQFRNQFEAGLISGQGSLNCLWQHDYYDGDRANEFGTDPEFPFYLAQLVLRTQQGADFDALLYIHKDGSNSKKNVYYEANCVITNVAVTVSASEVIETRIEFVTNGVIALKTGDTPGYLLQENADKILQENLSPILLEQV